ncbi:hypothetical protein ALC57_04951 [Trachymyrmex cornetzi]|uniref:DNA-directed DNA polymerase n=1 Tax=Trachymyrmex cornetzi TaxID=471704 RepID=A0A151JC07_9HYME|nr:hypothetical protein ALC57_04951 [Trachymyrmex cornetzi]
MLLEAERRRSISRWQRRLDELPLNGSGAIVRGSIGEDVEAWIGRAHGALTYRVTQVLTGHGVFESYLYRIGRRDTPICPFCRATSDTAAHTLLFCPFWAEQRWVDDVHNFDFTAIALDSQTGYILEVDLEYPQHLHDAHTDLPFCPTREIPPGKRHDKLLATLCDKQRYVIHYRNLQQCTRHDLRIAKIHRILQFTQSPWLRDYIELNTKFRTIAKNDFEKNLYKLMNNAVFGKTMENVRDRVDVKLLTKWEGRYGAEAMIAKPNFHSRSVFSENLVAIELRKLEVKFDKPIYVGMCILDISKTCLYEFHHEYMAPVFREKCKIMFTDTDSLIYHVECDDIYDVMKRDINRFDTSDYAVDNAYSIPLANKKVPGLMKDENNGAIMTECVGLRAKMYALRVQGKKDTKKAKGVKSSVVAKSIMFEDYTCCLNDAIEMTRRQPCIRSKLHEL